MMRDGGLGWREDGRLWREDQHGQVFGSSPGHSFLASQSLLAPLLTAPCHPRHPQALMNVCVLEFRPSSKMPFSFCNKPGLLVSGDFA